MIGLMFDVVSLASTLVIGLFTGSLLTEGMILIPYWRRMDPPEFFRLHGTLGPSLFRYFAPLTVSAVGLGLAVAVLDQGRTLEWVGTAALCLATLAIFYVYFRKANAGFADHAFADEALSAELTRWAVWHWLRTLLMVIAFGLSVLGHSVAAIA